MEPPQMSRRPLRLPETRTTVEQSSPFLGLQRLLYSASGVSSSRKQTAYVNTETRQRLESEHVNVMYSGKSNSPQQRRPHRDVLPEPERFLSFVDPISKFCYLHYR